MRILILGFTGMLGSMVAKYLARQEGLELILAARSPDKWSVGGETQAVTESLDLEQDNGWEQLGSIIRTHNPDYIINCIGITKPYCKDNDRAGRLRAIRINSWFPYELQRLAAENDSLIIQIATDCVYSGRDGKYTESSLHDALDVYGKSKSLGEVNASNCLHVRCSIIGPEIFNKTFLLEWFFSLPENGEAKGFAHHLWNGVTTLQFAELCHDIIKENRGLKFDEIVKSGNVHHFIPNATVNKYELMQIFSEIYEKPLTLQRVDNIGPSVDRTLASEKNLLMQGREEQPMKEAIYALRKFTEEVKFYS